MQQKIYTDSGELYITLDYDEDRGLVRMQLNQYDPQKIYVNFDRKAIPQMLSFLELVKSK
jgi:hypothetical protein